MADSASPAKTTSGTNQQSLALPHHIDEEKSIQCVCTNETRSLENSRSCLLHAKSSDSKTSTPVLPHDDEQTNTSTKIVDWEDDDPTKPRNWSKTRKLIVILTTAGTTFTVSFGSSIFASVVAVTAKEFHVSPEVMLLGVALYVGGFSLGPLIFGPASELYGRTRPLFLGLMIFCLFQLPTALSHNLPCILLFRFLQGVVGSAPLSIVGGMYMDFLEPISFGVAASIFTALVFAAPTCAPIFGALVTYSDHLGWRWTSWITLMIGVGFTALAILGAPETMENILLRRKAHRLRKETGDMELRAKCELLEDVKFSVFVHKYLTKPANMMMREPILIILTIYTALVYGILYLSFAAYPISFQKERGWAPVRSTLPYLGLTAGIIIASGIIAWYTMTRFARIARSDKGPTPEDRLPTMIAGSVILPIGLLVFALLSPSHINAVPQIVVGSLLTGTGIILIFMSAIIYIFDVYTIHANSAFAANTFVRSLAGGVGFPMFGGYMYDRDLGGLGVKNATLVLMGACILLMPAPWVFYKYGAKIRSWSRFAQP